MKKNRIFRLSLIITVFIMITAGLSAQYYKARTKTVTRLFGDKGNTSTVMAYIPEGTELDVLVVEEDYLKVLYEEEEGFIPTDKAVLRNTEGEIVRVGQQAEQAAQGVQQQQPVNRRELLIGKYGSRKGKAIFQHKVWKGMTNDMVYDSWGKPLRVDRLIEGSDISERWIYTESYLVFDDEILVDWGPLR